MLALEDPSVFIADADDHDIEARSPLARDRHPQRHWPTAADHVGIRGRGSRRRGDAALTVDQLGRGAFPIDLDLEHRSRRVDVEVDRLAGAVSIPWGVAPDLGDRRIVEWFLVAPAVPRIVMGRRPRAGNHPWLIEKRRAVIEGPPSGGGCHAMSLS